MSMIPDKGESDALVVRDEEDEDQAAPAEAAAPKKSLFQAWYDSWDADEIFCYNTPKTLRMLDRRLGLINLAGRSLIWLYVIVYVLLIEARMFKTAPGYGPTMLKVVNDTYVYSTTPSGSLPFTAFDSTDVVNPFLESSALFVTTELQVQEAQKMVSDKGRRLLALSQGENSKGAKGVNWQPAFGTGAVKHTLDKVEDMKVRYYATVSFPAVDPAGSTTLSVDGGFVGSNQGLELGKNMIRVGDILEKAGLTMSQVQTTGAILQVSLLWKCFLLLPEIFGKCQPTVEAVQLDQHNEKPGFSLWRTRHYTRAGTPVRDLEKLTGIRMLWRSVGSGFQFDIFAVVFHIAAGVALLPVAAMVTELVMWNFLPERKHYERSLYSETPDYYELDDIIADKEERERRKKEEDSAVDVEALFGSGLEDEHADME